MNAAALVIRPVEYDDLPALNDIYNHYIRETPITFDLEPISLERRREWFSHYATHGRHRLFAAVEAGRLLGYASSSRLRPKAAYDTSVETSVYLAADATGRGLGRQLYQALFDAIAEEDVHRAYAGITQPNEASVKLHERLGFKRIAVYEEVGRKFDRYWDTWWYQREL